MTFRRSLLALLAVAVLFTCAGLDQRPASSAAPGKGGHTPVVFVSGMTGTKLVDSRTRRIVWGRSRVLVSPRDGGRNLVLPLAAGGSDESPPVHPQAAFEASGPIWQMRFPGWTKPVYQPLRERFEREGYRLGDLEAPDPAADLFFFNYDWRYGNLDSVRRLDKLLSALAASRGGTDVDLICQSNAAKICRWLAKYGSLDIDAAEAGVAWERDYRIRTLVLAGVSNGGAMRVFKFLTQGRSYIALIGRELQPELFFTLRPLFEDLPAGRDDLFFDQNGEILEVDLFDPEAWIENGWSVFGRPATRRLERDPAPELFGTREEQLAYLERQLADSKRLQVLLARDSEQFPEARYYLLANESLPTIDRAMLARRGNEWRTFFSGDRAIDRSPGLRELAASAGDGHAVLASQADLSPQEHEALVETVMVEGKHFEAIITPEALDAMVRFVTTAP